MKTSIFDGVASVALLILLAGIAGGTQTGSSFSLAPAAAVLNAMMQSNPHDVGTEPLADLTRRAVSNTATATTEAIATAANDQTDPRLAGCAPGSVEAGEPISLGNAKTLAQMRVRSLIEVQGYFGRGPDCNEQNRWTYLIEGGGVLVATETKEGVNVTINR